MKKIINGKKYDTETAKRMVTRNNGYYNDFKYISETLYRKKTGEYFLHGEGGPMTVYAEPIGDNTWSGGEQIIPLKEREARRWAEEKISVDAYERIFGEVSE